MPLWWIALSCIPGLLVVGGYLYIRKKFSHFTKLGIPGPAPSLLTLGNGIEVFTKSVYQIDLDYLRRYGKVYGLYQGLHPMLVISDPELIKQICVKDFRLFVSLFESTTEHELVDRIIFLEHDADRWKRMRTVTTPCFSSGRLRKMCPLMERSIEKLIDYIDKRVMSDKSNQSGVIHNLRDIMIGFSVDLIAGSVFGLETDVNNSNSSEPFLTNALKILDMPLFTLIGVSLFPKWLNSLLGVRHIFNPESWNYFEQMAREIMRKRIAGESVPRNDLIDLLIKARVEEEEDQDSGQVSANTKLTETEIIAQAIGFLIGGFDNIASTLSYCLFELVKNPATQARLYAELEQSFSDLKLSPVPTELTEDHRESILNSSPFLEAVIKETLRMYPPFTATVRRLDANARDYPVANFKIQGGQQISISILAVHYNPEYFPNPCRFEPERFLPEYRHKVIPYSYMPFGQGPRNCLGLRFSMQVLKLCLALLCVRYRFEESSGTPGCPLEFLPAKIALTSSVPIEVKVKRRDNYLISDD